MSRLLSQRLEIREGADGQAVCCRGCGEAVAPAGAAWKPNALLRETRLRDVAPLYKTSEDLLLREFVCRGCGALLDTEIALPDDPFLEDRVVP